MTCVCSVGLDMIAVAGDTPPDMEDKESTDQRQARTGPIRIDAPELQRTIGQVLTQVADAWPRRQQVEGRVQRMTDANGSILVVGGNEHNDVADVLLGGRSQPNAAISLGCARRPS